VGVFPGSQGPTRNRALAHHGAPTSVPTAAQPYSTRPRPQPVSPRGVGRRPVENSQYIHAIRLDAAGNMIRRSVFADLNEGSEPGIPDGLKVDSIGRVYCTGPGGIWVMAPDGRRIGVIRWPEQAVNFAFGGPDRRTLLCCAHTSVYTLRVKVLGNPHPWYRRRGQ
jgi:SMP-30/Gluconolactonase/LRE-like region